MALFPIKFIGIQSFFTTGIANAQDKPKEVAQTPEQLCENRPPEEYFRLSTEGDCRDVVRCDRAGIAGAIRLAAVRCPAGLAFDVDRQTCDWKAKVTNCDKLDRKLTSITGLL